MQDVTNTVSLPFFYCRLDISFLLDTKYTSSFYHMIGPSDIVHPSPALHFRLSRYYFWTLIFHQKLQTQITPDIGRLFFHLNWCQQIVGDCKLRCCIMNFCSQAVRGAKLWWRYGVWLYFENQFLLKFQGLTLCDIHQSGTEVRVSHDCLVGSVHSKRNC